MRAQDNGPGAIDPQGMLKKERANKVHWQDQPAWAWKHITEDQFGTVRSYWASEDEFSRVETKPVFEITRGERVVLTMADRS